MSTPGRCPACNHRFDASVNPRFVSDSGSRRVWAMDCPKCKRVIQWQSLKPRVVRESPPVEVKSGWAIIVLIMAGLTYFTLTGIGIVVEVIRWSTRQ